MPDTTEKLTKYTVAAIQEPPVFLNLKESLAKARELIIEAGSKGAKLVVFPETWLPGYPVWSVFDSFFGSPRAKKTYRQLYENAIEVSGPEISELGGVCREADVILAMGVNERTSSGTIYNSILFINSDGTLLGIHRKLVPTYHERMIWGHGNGSTLHVFDTSIGRLSGLVCYENMMPLARYALYYKGAQIHAAVWPTPVKPYLLACRNMAAEGRLFVVVATTYFPKTVLSDLRDFEYQDIVEGLPNMISKGGSAIIGPEGDYIVEPTDGPETIYADIDLGRIIEEKQILDVVGHYARPEVFKLSINENDMRPAVFHVSHQ